MKSKANRYIGFFIVVLNLATVLNIYVVSDFVKNKDQIVKSLCIQKDFKVNTCQGKCHLQKELSTAKSSSQSDDKLVVNIPQFNFINSISISHNILLDKSIVFVDFFFTF